MDTYGPVPHLCPIRCEQVPVLKQHIFSRENYTPIPIKIAWFLVSLPTPWGGAGGVFSQDLTVSQVALRFDT